MMYILWAPVPLALRSQELSRVQTHKHTHTHLPCTLRQQHAGHSLAGIPLDAVGEGHLKGRGHTVQADWHLLLCRHVGVDYLKPRQRWSRSKRQRFIRCWFSLPLSLTQVFVRKLSCSIYKCSLVRSCFTILCKRTLHGSMKLWKQTPCSLHVPFIYLHSFIHVSQFYVNIHCTVPWNCGNIHCAVPWGTVHSAVL